MGFNYNKAILGGRLTKDPETRFTSDGKSVTTFSLAVNDWYKDKETAIFLDVTAFDKLSENVQKFLSKGSGAFVEGRLRMEEWDDKKTGERKKKLSVIASSVKFTDSKKSEDEGK